MLERSGAWWRVALAGAMLVATGAEGCSATVASAPSDAAVADVGRGDVVSTADVAVRDVVPTVDASVFDVPPVIDTPAVVVCDASTTRCGSTCTCATG